MCLIGQQNNGNHAETVRPKKISMCRIKPLCMTILYALNYISRISYRGGYPPLPAPIPPPPPKNYIQVVIIMTECSYTCMYINTGVNFQKHACLIFFPFYFKSYRHPDQSRKQVKNNNYNELVVSGLFSHALSMTNFGGESFRTKQ